ncbi:hypothetical protein [Anaerovorax sp. IOR16]|uniref:hypothetical protein n=1 Tax=Anaerovorax sp. IOR16 TaxID=2773458 RepID=UPI0019D00ACB|nr:hypothetical protein [Anaerovorax sp. IOR16]
MNKCIYLVECTDELTYSSGEHVIPAGLGGISKLPKGFVSDQVNNIFSKYELRAIRSSLLIGNRIRHGPGKRGNQNVKKEKVPIIRLLKDETSNNQYYLLGYIFLGDAYILPQICCSFGYVSDTMSINYLGDNFEVKDYEQYLLEFRVKLINFLIDKNKHYIFVKDEFKKSKDTINIGFYKGKWYLSTNIPLFDVNNIAKKILTHIFQNSISFKKSTTKNVVKEFEKIKFKYRQTIDISDDSFSFMFVKTAFNALSYLMGQDFVLLNIFDKLRNDIVGCKNMSSYIKPSDMHEEIFSKNIPQMPEYAHCIYIVSKGNNIFSYVSFYNEWHAHMLLTDEYKGDDFIVGFVCDWKSKKEYSYN